MTQSFANSAAVDAAPIGLVVDETCAPGVADALGQSLAAAGLEVVRLPWSSLSTARPVEWSLAPRWLIFTAFPLDLVPEEGMTVEDLDATVGAWRAPAAAIAAWLRSSMADWRLFDLAEARRRPDALSLAITQFVQRPVSVSLPPPSWQSVQGWTRDFLSLQVRSQPAVRALVEELFASTTPLGPVEASRDDRALLLEVRSGMDAEWAVMRAERDDAVAQLAQATRLQSDSQARAAQAEQDLAYADLRQAALQRELDAVYEHSRDAATSAETRLQACQEELRQLRASAEASERQHARDMAEARQRQGEVEAARDAMTAQWQEVQTELPGLRQQAKALEAAERQVRANALQIERLTSALEAARQRIVEAESARLTIFGQWQSLQADLPGLRERAGALVIVEERARATAAELARASTARDEALQKLERMAEVQQATQAALDEADRRLADMADTQQRTAQALDELTRQRDLLAAQVEAAELAAQATLQQLGEMAGQREALAAQLAISEADLQATRQQLDEVTGQREALSAQLAISKADLAATGQQVDEVTAQCEALAAQLAASQADQAVMRQQLGETAGQRDALAVQLAASHADLAANRQHLVASEQATEACRERLSVAERRATDMERRAAALRQEADVLLQQLHTTQEELEIQFLQWQERDAAEEARRRANPPWVTMSDVIVEAVSETSTHRHVDLRLVDLSLAGADPVEVVLRVVEHQGRPGLLFWAAESDPRILSGVRSNGNEEGRPFILLVPEDPSGRRLLDHLGTRDWRVLQAIVRSLQDVWPTDDTSLLRWGACLGRLVVAFDDEPLRLRYDAVSFGVDDGRHVVTVGGASLGGEDVGTLRFGFRPGEGAFTWLRESRDEPVCLSFWPTEESGMPVAALHVPIREAASQDFWRPRMGRDRAVLMALLEAMPGWFAAQGDEPVAKRLLAETSGWHKAVRRMLWSARVRAGLRRALSGRT